MKIIWNRVTRFSQIVAIILFVAVYFAGFQIGRTFERQSILGGPIAKANYACVEGKKIYAEYFNSFVHIEIGGQNLYMPQTISASGARYALPNDALVFWNKGNTAFITKGDPNNVTYKDCVSN